MPQFCSRLGPLLSCLYVWFALGGASVAQAAPDADVPEPLKPWTSWALRGSEEERCVRLQEVRACVFPSALTLRADARGAEFSLRVVVDQRRAVALPGSKEHFPRDVREAKAALAVADVEGVPTVWLEPGTHLISGRFDFSALPDTLQLPTGLALLDLNVAGARVALPKREANGLVWLKQTRDSADEERLALSVHRRIEDGIPLRITTRLHVSAGGKPREVLLPQVLVPETRPIQLQADLPVELNAQGALRLQVQAGEHDVEFVAIRESEVGVLAAPENGSPWPERELWVLKSDELLRHTEVSGPSQIDPARTDLAPDWRGLPTYVMPPKQTLKLETKRRGEPEPPPNQLSLNRSLWLDLDGDGYTVKDALGGQMRQGFRLELRSAHMGHAVDHGVDQLITDSRGQGGVELRQQDVRLETEWRLEHAQSELPAVGYNEDIHSLSATLHLPPGFMLLGADGVDQLYGTWLDSWDLFDFFFVLLISLAVAKLSGKLFGLCALIALVLTHQEADAPAVSWVFLLAVTALHGALTNERISRWLKAAWLFALATVVIALLPFSVLQMRKALYLHLDAQAQSPWQSAGGLESASEALRMEPAPAAPPLEAPLAQPEELEQGAAGGAAANAPRADKSVRRERAKDSDSYDLAAIVSKRASSDVDPSAVVQTGPGLPSWSFRQFSLSWSGPVQKDQRIQLWLVTPPFTRTWALASVAFSALLLLALVRAFRRAGQPPVAPPPKRSSKESLATTYVGLLALFACALPASARAQGAFPAPELLGELRARLLAPAPCEPNCLSVNTMLLRIDPAQLSVSAEVHAQARAIYAAPGPLDSWSPDKVLVDGSDAAALRSEDGFLRIRLEPGVHTIQLSGPIPASQAFTLALGDQPHQLRAEHKGFVIDGLRDDGRAEGSLSIRREVAASSAALDHQGLVSWFEVRRELDLGIRFRVRTTVTRLGASSDSAVLRVPLLPGEEVSEAGLVSDQGSVVVTLPRGEASLSYASSMAPTPKLVLRAALPSTAQGALTQPFSETWVVAPSVLYRARFDGLAPISHVDESGTYRPQYRPFPGETLTIEAARLTGAEGVSTTADRAHVLFTPGSRIEQATVTLALRTSRGSTERLVVPEDAQLLGVSVDGAPRPARLKQGKLELHVDPGAHQIVASLQRGRGLAFEYRPFPVAFERPLNNVLSEVRIPDGRWLLFARGPGWGPAVLFWGYLMVIVLCAVGLGQVPRSPLKTHQWILLSLGLTQIEPQVALVIVGWLFALAYREHSWPKHRVVFNLTQVALVLLTLNALVCLGYAVHNGLVVQPSMQVQGMGSTDQLLRWYADRSGGRFPDLSVWSAPLWLYKALMLLWALWLAALVIRWLRYSLFALRRGGGWRAREKRPTPQASATLPGPPASSEAAPAEGGAGPEGAGVP